MNDDYSLQQFTIEVGKVLMDTTFPHNPFETYSNIEGGGVKNLIAHFVFFMDFIF